jgi:hypothetical protein
MMPLDSPVSFNYEPFSDDAVSCGVIEAALNKPHPRPEPSKTRKARDSLPLPFGS